MLESLKQALLKLTDRVFHYVAEPNSTPPYLVWMEDGANDLESDDRHTEKALTGTVDLYTEADADPLFSSVPDALEGVGFSWFLNSVQYEEETNLTHYEWVWEAV